jgi:hypothetical protein
MPAPPLATNTQPLTIRLSDPVSRDANDLALLYDMTLNEYLNLAIANFNDLQMKQPAVMRALENARAIRARGPIKNPSET